MNLLINTFISSKIAFRLRVLATVLFAFCLLLSGCTNAKQSEDSFKNIKLNQIGYQPKAPKAAIVAHGQYEDFEVIHVDSGKQALSGKLGSSKKWPYSGELVRQADFSELTKSGKYFLRVKGLPDSYTFEIKDSVMLATHNAAIKAFYFNRAGIEITKELGGQHARAAGHPDIKVEVHESAQTKNRPSGTILSSPKGWYDAGDYGKYVVNSGISTYTLMMSYLHHADFYESLNLSIPESSDSIPDLINEIKWNLDWLETMQDEDGGVYHKMTAKRFSDMSASPEKEDLQRYMIGKSVTASLDFSAVMAVASRVMKPYDSQFPGLSKRYLNRAVLAYQWAQANPKALYKQPSDISTGAYGDKSAEDEFAWAAAELFLSTEEPAYFDDFLARKSSASANLSWPSVGALAYLSLSTNGEKLLPDEQYKRIRKEVLSASEAHYQVYANSAYDVAISKPDFVWGSNGDVLNNGIILMQGYRLSGDKKFLNAAMSTVDYVLGKNATGYSFVTGHGDKTPMNIHHRPSTSDKTDIPVPGFLAGGPHSGQQDNCDYPSTKPALSYSETVCSYASNEIAINWNAPLVYMLAAAVNAEF